MNKILLFSLFLPLSLFGQGTEIRRAGGGTGTGSSAVVSASGDDSGGLGTSAKPFFSLERAYQQVGDGGVIELLSGNYTNLNLRLTNRNVTISSSGFCNIYNGSNVSSFTLVAGTTYSFLAISNAWGSNNTGLNIGGPEIYEFNSSETFIPLINRYPHEYMHNQGLRFCYRLTNCQSLANLAAATTGCYFPSNDVNGNSTIFLKFSDNTVPGVRTILLPTRSTTNCLIWGGAAGGRVTISGVNVFGAYNGVDITGIDYYKDNNVTYACSTDSGIFSGDISASIEGNQSSYLANNNDGVSVTTGGDRTNVNSVILRRCVIGWNGDEGTSCHYGGPIDHEGCIIEYNRQGGFTPYAGGRMTDIGSVVRNNGYGVYNGGAPITINGGWTNFPTHWFGVGTKFYGNNFGWFWESGQSNALLYGKNCSFSNNVDFALSPSTTFQYAFIEDCTVSLTGQFRQNDGFTNPIVVGDVFFPGPSGSILRGKFPATVTASFTTGAFTNTFTNDCIVLMGHGSATGARTNRLPDASICPGMTVTLIDTVNTAGNANSNVWVETTANQLIQFAIVRTNMNKDGGRMTLQATPAAGLNGWRILERP